MPPRCVTLEKSRKLGCASALPGIQAIGIAEFDQNKKIVKTNTGVTALALIYGADSIARFEVKNTTIKYIENGVSGGDNRSKGVKGTLPVVLNMPPGLDVEVTTDIEQLMNGPVVFFIEKKNGDIFACGTQCGADAITIDSDTGGQSGDLDGFTVTFNTEEPHFSRLYKLSGAALVDYAAAIMDV